MRKVIITLIIIAGLAYLFMGKKEIKNFPNSNQNIVAFGDSLTAGYGAPKGNSYPDYLGQRLNRPVINMGVSGELAIQASARLPEVLAQQPYMVLIEFGGNDFMQQRSAQAAVEAVSQLVDAVQEAGAIAVIVDIGGPGMEKYTTAYKKIAKEKGAIFVPGILNGIFAKRAFKSDAVHPNAAGYEQVADKVYQKIKTYVK